MNFSYTTRKNMSDGTEVRTVEGLDIPGRTFALTLTTSKSGRGGISAIASVAEHKDGFITMDLFGDYRATLATSPSRATEKALIGLHEKALDTFAEHIAKATAHTLAKVAKSEKQEAEAKARAESFTASQASAAMEDSNYVGHASHY